MLVRLPDQPGRAAAIESLAVAADLVVDCVPDLSQPAPASEWLALAGTG
jgi:hypothetical protein